MPAPEWRTATAKDGETQVSILVTASNTISIRLSSGSVSIVAAVARDVLSELIPTPEQGIAAPEARAA